MLWRKFPKFLMSVLKAQISFLQILNQSSVPLNVTTLHIFSSSIIYIVQRQSSNVQIFEICKCLDQNSSNSSSQFWTGNSIFASFFIVMTHNSPVNLKLINFQLWTKESHRSHNFETFKCSGENLPNSSCYFPNHKLVFLQILHHSLVSWKITFLGQKLPERADQSAKSWDFWVLGSKFTNFYHFWNKSVFLQFFLSISSVIKHNSTVLSNLKH